jgi:hypothetical protein
MVTAFFPQCRAEQYLGLGRPFLVDPCNVTQRFPQRRDATRSMHHPIFTNANDRSFDRRMLIIKNCKESDQR